MSWTECETSGSRTSPARRCDYWWDDATKWGLAVSTAPVSYPVSVAEVKQQARIDESEEDGWLLGLIGAATRLCEGYIKRAFVTQSLRLTLDRMPSGLFYLPRPKLISVTSLKYYDTNGTQQTISNTNYRVDTYSEPGRIEFVSTYSRPSVQDRINAIEVIYAAGYGAPSAVPDTVKQAIMVALSAWNEDREGMGALPEASKSLLRSEHWGYLP